MTPCLNPSGFSNSSVTRKTQAPPHRSMAWLPRSALGIRRDTPASPGPWEDSRKRDREFAFARDPVSIRTDRSVPTDSGVASWLVIGLLLAVPAWSPAAEPLTPAVAVHQEEAAPVLTRILPNGTTARGDSSKPVARPSSSRAQLKAMVDQTARQYGLDRDLVHALIQAESAYNPRAVSPAGAVGLMQVMPDTAADYGVNTPATLFEPETNLNTGMRHFKRLLDKYGSIGSAVMAYNAGEGALERSGGFVTYAETQRYTHQVLTTYLGSKGIAPYSARAREAIGITLTPAMANAVGGGQSPVTANSKPISPRPRPSGGRRYNGLSSRLC